jgi:O-antigen ligase
MMAGLEGKSLLQALHADRRQNLMAMLLVGVAMVLGGGGSPSPLSETGLQLVAFAMLVMWAATAKGPVFRADRSAWIIAGLLLALPLIQLVPLPPGAWHALPGRQVERAALALIGQEDSWRAWSVAPQRTLAALLALAVPVIVLLMVASLDRKGRAMAVAMIAGVAFLALLVGVAQMAGGEANTLRFYVPDQPYLNGFQANHNSAADVLLIGIVAFAAALREGVAIRRARLRPGVCIALVGGMTALLSLGVFLTASRAGALLLPVAWLGVGIIAYPWIRLPRKLVWRVAAVGAILIGIALFLLSTNDVVVRVLGRYQFAGEFRPKLWRDAQYAINQFLPFGSGLGTFVPVFIAAERLEAVDATMPNRAHNDYLELLIEGGVFGALALSVISAILTRQLWRRLRDGAGEDRAVAVFAGATLAVVALHSLVDYPLRSMSLACIAAVAAGLLMPLASRLGAHSQMLERTTKEQT